MELQVLSQLRHITLYYDHPGGIKVDENVLRFSGAALSRHKLALEHPRPSQGDPDLISYPFRFGLVFADQHKSYRARVAETMGRDEDTFYRSTIVPRFERSINHPMSFLDSVDRSFPCGRVTGCSAPYFHIYHVPDAGRYILSLEASSEREPCQEEYCMQWPRHARNES